MDQAAELFLELTNPSNELFLLAFNSTRSSSTKTSHGTSKISAMPFSTRSSPGAPALYDAIYLAVEHAAEGSEPKKVVIVFTDGEDKDSYYELEEVIEKVEAVGCPGLPGGLPGPGPAR